METEKQKANCTMDDNVNLSDDIQKDLHLRKILLGEIEGELTGYVSLDKPWLKNYSEEQICTVFEPKSMYQLMFEKNAGHEKDIALSYFGNKISFEKMFCNIDLTAKSLIEMGVHKGDMVMMSLPNIPEAVYIFYALNKLGVVVNSIDPRTSAELIKKDIIESKAKVIFAIDVIYRKIESIAKDTKIENIIVVSPFESLLQPLKTIARLKAKKVVNQNNELVMEWKEFLKNGKKSVTVVPTEFDKGEAALIVHTGGSTGTPKGVMLSNESCNALIYQLLNSKIELQRKNIFLNLLPPFIALGIVNATHLAVCAGLETVLIPSFEPEDFPKLILKHKPNLVMGGPIHFNIMINSKEMKNADLSFLEVCVAGGDKLPRESQIKIQEFLKAHNAKANICIGYGATETSAGTACMSNSDFRYESVGVPYLKNVMEVFDQDSGEKLKGFNKVGELRVNAPTIMNGYWGENANEMNDVIKVDENGNKWYCTGDLAHFDEDGFLYIDGRIKRIITRRGFKIYPLFIEEMILKHPAVKECAVVGVPDSDEINIPVANIVLRDTCKTSEVEREVVNYIDKFIGENLPEYSVMAGYNFLDELPATPIGKLDFKKLETMGILGDTEKRMQEKFRFDDK